MSGEPGADFEKLAVFFVGAVDGANNLVHAALRNRHAMIVDRNSASAGVDGDARRGVLHAVSVGIIGRAGGGRRLASAYHIAVEFGYDRGHRARDDLKRGGRLVDET